MKFRRLFVPLFVLLSALLAAAQEDLAGAEAALTRAVQALEQAPSYHFTYSFLPRADATSPISGEGAADLSAQRWRYTLQSDPADPTADRSKDGEWIATGATWYHNAGAGWAASAADFTSMGVTSILAPFASYDTFKTLASGDEEALGELQLVGRETVDGLEADHYQFSLKEMPLYGTGQYDAWVSEEGGEVRRVILAVTPEGGQPSRVAFSNIGEPVTIEAPQ